MGCLREMGHSQKVTILVPGKGTRKAMGEAL
jgi:hypothetical protein